MIRKLNKICLALLSACLVISTPAHAFEDAIITIVNDEVITLRDLKEYMQNVYAQLRVEGKNEAEIALVAAEYEDKGINQLIRDKLILSKANELGIQVKQEFIDQRIDEIRANYSSEEEFLTVLKREGMSVTDMREKLSDQLKAKYIVDLEVRSKIYVNPQEVNEFYNDHMDEFKRKPRVFLESIFISSLTGLEMAQKKAADVMSKIESGENFEDLIERYSDLPSVGVIEKGQMLGTIEDKIFGMSVGKISDPIEVDNGIYIFKITGRVPGYTAPLKEIKDDIHRRIFNQKFKVEYEKWIKKLRSEAYIEIK